MPSNSSQSNQELPFDEIRCIVDQARAMGCQAWGISGGEPMLRSDFSEIFDYITHKSVSYKLNTNGTLITPEIALLMKRKGNKMIALYGATADVHDRVTRNPGSFDATMRGFAYLKEVGTNFTVQLIPMRENFHQYGEMVALARSISPHYRVGANWLWLSAYQSESRNIEIKRQRLDPADLITIDEPFPINEASDHGEEVACNVSCTEPQTDDRLFASCIASRRDFHIDPYGHMSFCYYIKNPVLRYDLRKGTFCQAWDEFIPSLAEVVHGGQEYQDNCGSCMLRKDCHWCGVYSYLEHGRYTAKVNYLCQVATETRRFKENWKLNHMRYYQIGGISIQLMTDFPLTENTFAPAINKFQTDAPEKDIISLRLISSVPTLSELNLGKEVHRRPPWAIYQQVGLWVYMAFSPNNKNSDPYLVSICDEDYSRVTICRRRDHLIRGKLGTLTTFSSDQILLAPILASRQGCILHAAGFVLDGKGLLFVGHSGAGKSTILKMLREYGDILCDDRIILRCWPDGFRIHGTWSHGELPDVSPASVPLRAILYLEQAPTNELIPLSGKRERLGGVLSHVIKPFITAEWWEKTLVLAGKIAVEVPAYRLRFDKSGQVVDLLREL